MPVYGRARVTVEVGQTEAIVDVVVAEIECDGILGMDFLLGVGFILDLENKRIRCGGHEVRCEGGIRARLRLQEAVVVPPGHEVAIPVQI